MFTKTKTNSFWCGKGFSGSNSATGSWSFRQANASPIAQCIIKSYAEVKALPIASGRVVLSVPDELRVDVLEEFEGTGKDRAVVGHVKKWKLADKSKALDMLMKHLGGFKEDNDQKANPLTALLARIGRSTLPVVRDAGDDDGC